MQETVNTKTVVVHPMCRKNKGLPNAQIRCNLNSGFCIGLSLFFSQGPEMISSKIESVHIMGRESEHRCFLSCSFWALAPASDGTFPGYFDSRAEMSVRVGKGGFMVKTL